MQSFLPLALFALITAASARASFPQHPPAPAPAAAETRSQTLEGAWTGSLQAGDAVLHLVLHISKGDNASLKATLDSLDQGVYGIEASSIVRTQSSLTLEALSVNAAFAGTISPDHRTIEGTWSQSGASLPLVFHRQPHTAANSKPSGAVAGAEGLWQGALETSGMRFRLQLHISHDNQNQLVATLDSIDQGIRGFPATHVSQTDSAVHLEVPAVEGTYDGRLNAAKNAISGAWKQGGNSSPVSFQRSDQILELRRPQTPVKPYPYREEGVRLAGAKGEVLLDGTLTLPHGAGPFAAAVLLAGSGPLDRDAADSGHRPFLVLADYLTRRGVAVLRFDKRGIGKSTGGYEQATTADFADDAEAAITFLKSRKDMDAAKIGLIGHSEGALIATMIAARSPGVAWVVLLSGPATTGEQTLLLRSDLIARAAGMTDEQVAQSLDFDRQSYSLVRQERDRAVLEKNLNALVKSSEQGQAMAPDVVERQIHWISSPWFRYSLDYNPAPALQKTKCAVLALTGEKDLQVPPKENVPLIEKALKEAGNQDFQVVELPDLNHLFQHCQTGVPAESRAIDETFAPEALAAISDWVLKHVSR